MKLYKLTDRNGFTSGNTKWEKGTILQLPHTPHPTLCSKYVIHAYKNPNLAFLLNSIHANFFNPLLWEARGEIAVEDWGKVGCFKLEIISKMDKPAWINTEKEIYVRVMFSTLCAESVLRFFEDNYPKDNRPRKAIEAAKKYLKTKSNADAHVAALAASAAAHAANAADAAAPAAYAAANAAAHAAYAAAYAAYAAAHDAYAANAAYAADASINFCKIADMAVELVIKE
jgi:hypothetical protein